MFGKNERNEGKTQREYSSVGHKIVTSPQCLFLLFLPAQLHIIRFNTRKCLRKIYKNIAVLKSFKA